MNSRLAAAIFSLGALAPLTAPAALSVSIRIGPPALPIYEQPSLPGDGYIWTPGYWGWSEIDSDYYWVPGTWVLAPVPGYLWTPGYWGYIGTSYRWNRGYWATRVGFYGGINYGFGYTGRGYQGGRWDRGVFKYNTQVNNVNKTVVHNTYNTVVINHNTTRASFNGGTGGVTARPDAQELRVQKAKHIEPTENQSQHERTALATPDQKASVNRGTPKIAATPKADAFSDAGAVRAREEPAAADKPAMKEAAASAKPAPKEAAAAKPADAQPAARAPEGDSAPAPRAAEATAAEPKAAQSKAERRAAVKQEAEQRAEQRANQRPKKERD